MERLGRQTCHGVRFAQIASSGRGRDSAAHNREGGGWVVLVGVVCAWGCMGPCYGYHFQKHSTVQPDS